VSRRQTYSIAEIRDMLTARVEDVARHYAPPASGSYTANGVYFTLNPGRADRSVGSFAVQLRGPKAGKWNDYATGAHGDLIDLIGLSLGLDSVGAIREARRWLGLEHDTPETKRAREAAAAKLAASRKAEAKRQAEALARKRRVAEGMFLAGLPVAGTPVEAYLAARAINLRQLGSQPNAIRYLAECSYHHSETDPETGEIFEMKLRLPAMVAAIVNGRGEIIALHRTWLAIAPDGVWRKAAITSPRTGAALPVKKVLGDFRGGAIRLGNGVGPRGGKAARLAECPPGSRVYIAEGIETALSARILRPDARVLAAVSLANMGQIELPENVAEVVLITDGDEHPQAQEQLARAIKAHAAAGRVVRIWASNRPGEDLNDALQRAMRDEENHAEQ
jgi:hypothetical protein